MNNYIFKFIISGDSNVGKSTFLEQYINNSYIENYDPTIGVSFGHKTVYIDNNETKIQMWDLCGDPRFENIIRSYYISSHCVLILFDLSDMESFNNIPKWINIAKEEIYNTENKTKIYLIGNKSDKKKKVTNEMIHDICKIYNIKYYELTSKKYNEINKVMTNILYELYLDLIKGNNHSYGADLEEYNNQSLLQKKKKDINKNENKSKFWKFCSIL
jgi:Ras-related protein Rab-1A